MSKSLEELLLGVENHAAASDTVRRAVERAEMAGLPPAFQLESGKLAWLEKDPRTLLELRRAARQEKKQRDDEHRELHSQLLQLLDGPQGEWMRRKAHEQIDKWEARKLCSPRYVEQWRLILAVPAGERAKAVLRDDDTGVALRQNSPFDHSFHLVTHRNRTV